MIYVCGVDEAGRGPLAGDVYAAAVIIDQNKPIMGLKDSKQLSAKIREELYYEILEKALDYSIAKSSVEEIDTINILQATLLAMQRAVNGLKIKPTKVLIDGNKAPKLDIHTETIIKGDTKINEISAASILAKVTRDQSMLELDKLYPMYEFAKHKGYGTKLHLEKIKLYGSLNVHRKSFAPIKYFKI